MKITFSLMWRNFILLLIVQQCAAFSARKNWSRGESISDFKIMDSYEEGVKMTRKPQQRIKQFEHRLGNEESATLVDDVDTDSIWNYEEGSQRSVKPLRVSEISDKAGSTLNSNNEEREDGKLRGRLDRQNDASQPFRLDSTTQEKTTGRIGKEPRKKGINGTIIVLIIVFGLILASVVICGICAKINPKFASLLSRRDRVGYMQLKRRQKKGQKRQMVNRKNKDIELGHPTERIGEQSLDLAVPDGTKRDPQHILDSLTETQSIANNSGIEAGIGKTVDGKAQFGRQSQSMSDGNIELLASSGDDDARSKRKRDAVSKEISSSVDSIRPKCRTDSRTIPIIYTGVSNLTDHQTDTIDSEYEEGISKLGSIRYFFHHLKANFAAFLRRRFKVESQEAEVSRASYADIVLCNKQLHSSFTRDCIGEPNRVQVDVRESGINPISDGEVYAWPELNLASETIYENFQRSKKSLQRMDCRNAVQSIDHLTYEGTDMNSFERNSAEQNVNLPSQNDLSPKTKSIQNVESVGAKKDSALMYSLKQYSDAELHLKKPQLPRTHLTKKKKKRIKAQIKAQSTYLNVDENSLYADISGEMKQKLEPEFVLKQFCVSEEGGPWEITEKSFSKENQDGNVLDKTSENCVDEEANFLGISTSWANSNNATHNQKRECLEKYKHADCLEKFTSLSTTKDSSCASEDKFLCGIATCSETMASSYPMQDENDADDSNGFESNCETTRNQFSDIKRIEIDTIEGTTSHSSCDQQCSKYQHISLSLPEIDHAWDVDIWGASTNDSSITAARESIEDVFNEVGSAEFVISRQVTVGSNCSKTISGLSTGEPRSPYLFLKHPFCPKKKITSVMSDSGINIRRNEFTCKKSISETYVGNAKLTPSRTSAAPKKKINTTCSDKSIQTDSLCKVSKKRWKFIRRIFKKKKKNRTKCPGF